MNVLDIIQNSISAKAKNITVKICEDTRLDKMTITISDDGCGMSEEALKKVCDPFVTSRTTRKVGLGIPLFKSAAEAAGGEFKIESQEGAGTTVTAVFSLSNIDRAPLGDIGGTMSAVICMNAGISFVYTHEKDGGSFTLRSEDLKEQLLEVLPDSPEIIQWLREYIDENIKNLDGGQML